MEEKPLVGIVHRLVREGKHGPYAVCSAEEAGIEGSITFSLQPPVWQESSWPQSGTFVVLEGLARKRSGWRATSARFAKPHDIQAVSKVSRLIQEWLNQFPWSEQDEEIWRAWVNLQPRENFDLRELIKDRDVREGFRARALVLLLTPDFVIVPLFWVQPSQTNFLGSLAQLETPKEFFPYKLMLVACFYSYLKGKKREVLTWSEKCAMEAYNEHIASLLRILHTRDIEVVFPLLSVINPLDDNQVDLKPLIELLRDQRISQRWREEADKKAREFVAAEVASMNDPKPVHEGILSNYIDVVRWTGLSRKPSYSPKLLLDQLRFIVATMPLDYKHNISFNRIEAEMALWIIGASGPREFAREFAQFLVRACKFYPRYESEIPFTLRLIELLGQETLLAQELDRSIQEIRQRSQQSEEYWRKRRQDEDALYRQMMKPA